RVLVLPRAVPQLAVDEAHPRDEAVRGDRAQHAAARRIDDVDLALAILADEEEALRPRHAGVAAFARRWNRVHDAAGLGLDLVDALLGDLIEMRAVERGAGVGRDVDRGDGLAARRIERIHPRPSRIPNVLPIERHPRNILDARKRPILTNNLGIAGLHR